MTELLYKKLPWLYCKQACERIGKVENSPKVVLQERKGLHFFSSSSDATNAFNVRPKLPTIMASDVVPKELIFKHLNFLALRKILVSGKTYVPSLCSQRNSFLCLECLK